ncbi:hypothetical protein I7I50_02258 [Histoplasma capsulatum G186AR]|uniref:Uncharacterized protein n=1 Tax=Ajellomyces capsulatus TaxID=5037 RepID=A0A8H8D601_AJECA|nr:hypothetical protein I7I52_01078 [Histoplasma capsulatum]QSS71428.1 hypothetical protein I7I50_02258 [Histoplasma capsulatum G186AR]
MAKEGEEDRDRDGKNWWVECREVGKGRAFCQSFLPPPVFTWSIYIAIEERIGSSMQPPTAKGELEIGRWTAVRDTSIYISCRVFCARKESVCWIFPWTTNHS